ncbi:MAG: alpha/beta hydrolase [Burkholderiales bacterium]|nr:MAG: alpha/beta hydrolase [Burkholderiales bacterium]
MTDEQFVAGQDRTMAMLVKSDAARPTAKQWSLASDRKVMATAMYEDMITDTRPLLPQIKAKTTVVYAYDAQMGRPTEFLDGMYAKAYEGLAGAKMKRIDGGFHFIMLDQPAAFAKEVDAFLK